MRRSTHHGTGNGTSRVSWLSSGAPYKAPWHVSWHELWHASCVLSRLVGTKQGPVARVMAWAVARAVCIGRFMSTMQGPVACVMTRAVACVMARAVARVMCLGPARGHHARPHGTCHGIGGGMRCVSWLGLWAPSKAPWHASRHK